MNRKSLLKKLKLDDKAFDEIRQAVQAAEKKTSGEIAVAVVSESSSYAYWELKAAVMTGLLLLCCLFPLAGQIYSWMDRVFWGVQPWYLAAFYVVVVAIVILALYFAYNIPAVDSVVVPHGAKHAAVSRRAMRYFAESGVYCTSNHSGVLIFVSYFEKEVRVIADKGISEKITQDLWNLIADDLADGVASGHAKEAFVSAVERCGELMAEHFPVQDDVSDELDDGLVVLEDDRWV